MARIVSGRAALVHVYCDHPIVVLSMLAIENDLGARSAEPDRRTAERRFRWTLRVVLADVTATLGPGYESMVRDIAGRLPECIDDPARYLERIVEDTQQDFHDGYIDTDWPKCRLHDGRCNIENCNENGLLTRHRSPTR